MTREQTYGALFAFFAALTAGGAPAFKTSTRKLRHWDSCPAEDSPALYMRQVTETAVRTRGLPTKWTLSIELWLYARTNAQNDDSVIPSQVLNPLLDAVEAALQPDDLANNAVTLNGLVSHAAIEGPIQVYEGDMGDEAVAIVPITVLIPS